MERGIFETNGGSGIYAFAENVVYWANDGELGINLEDEKKVKETFGHEWDLDNFHMAEKGEFLEGMEGAIFNPIDTWNEIT